MEDSEDSQSIEEQPNVPSPSRENAPISPPDSAETIQIDEQSQEKPSPAPEPVEKESENTLEVDTFSSEPKVQSEKKRYFKNK